MTKCHYRLTLKSIYSNFLRLSFTHSFLLIFNSIDAAPAANCFLCHISRFKQEDWL